MVDIEHIRKLKKETEKEIVRLLSELEPKIGLHIRKIHVHPKSIGRDKDGNYLDEFMRPIASTDLYDVDILLDRI